MTPPSPSTTLEAIQRMAGHPTLYELDVILMVGPNEISFEFPAMGIDSIVHRRHSRNPQGFGDTLAKTIRDNFSLGEYRFTLSVRDGVRLVKADVLDLHTGPKKADRKERVRIRLAIAEHLSFLHRELIAHLEMWNEMTDDPCHLTDLHDPMRAYLSYRLAVNDPSSLIEELEAGELWGVTFLTVEDFERRQRYREHASLHSLFTIFQSTQDEQEDMGEASTVWDVPRISFGQRRPGFEDILKCNRLPAQTPFHGFWGSVFTNAAERLVNAWVHKEIGPVLRNMIAGRIGDLRSAHDRLSQILNPPEPAPAPELKQNEEPTSEPCTDYDSSNGDCRACAWAPTITQPDEPTGSGPTLVPPDEDLEPPVVTELDGPPVEG